MHIYTQALIAQIAQSSACNRMHPVEQRCARWLLQSHDRAKVNEFQLTHEFLGIMLGVRRASVTEVAGKLQDRGLISYHSGMIKVINREGLEKASCDCYALITASTTSCSAPNWVASAEVDGPASCRCDRPVH